MDKRILITGGTGFVGANLTIALLKKGYEIHLLIREQSNFWRINDILKDVYIYNVNLNQVSEVDAVFNRIKPDVVLHLATYGAYPYRNGLPYQQDLDELINTNILSTKNLLLTSEKYDVRLFINTGSTSEYGIKNSPMNENDLLTPVNAYGATKAAATLLVNSLATSLRTQVVTLRLFSVYGYYEDPNRLIPTIILSNLNKVPAKLANPNSVRDFIFIEDVINVYEHFLMLPKIENKIYNIGTGIQSSVLDISEKINNYMDNETPVFWGEIDISPKEPEKWVSNNTLLLKTGWKPNFTLSEGLKKTSDWFCEKKQLYNK